MTITRFWKGRPKHSQCGSQMKMGLQLHPDLKCQLAEGHLGNHCGPDMQTWPRSAEEMEAFLNQLDDARVEK